MTEREGRGEDGEYDKRGKSKGRGERMRRKRDRVVREKEEGRT